MSDLKIETLTDEVSKLLSERDQLKNEVAKLTAMVDRAINGVSLLTEATLLALDYLGSPNPFVDRERQRTRAILHMEDALAVNGCEVARFEVRSDAN